MKKNVRKKRSVVEGFDGIKKILKLFVICFVTAFGLTAADSFLHPSEGQKTAEYSAKDPIDIPTERDWNAVMTLPSRSEIDAFNGKTTNYTPRSPYLAGYMRTNMCENFIAYSVEFRSDFRAPGTYCSTANVTLDYSSLLSSYKEFHSDYWMSLYNGLQVGDNGSTNAIFTIWDQYLTDYAGNESVLRAELIYPEGEAAMENKTQLEGNFVHYLPAYNWEAGRWYRMDLKCEESASRGHTVIEMWVTDVEKNRSTKICAYDLGASNITMKGDVCVFLEDFFTTTAGDVRSMECRNFRITDVNGQEHQLTEGYFCENKQYPGSYRYGSDGEVFYMVTTGIPDKAGVPQEPETLTVHGN